MYNRGRRFGIAIALFVGCLSALTSVATPAGATPSVHTVLDFTENATGGAWQAIDTSVLTPTIAQLQGSTSVVVQGVLHVYGLDASGNLLDLSARSSGGAWQSTNLTTAINGPQLVGDVRVMAGSNGQIDVFGLGSGANTGRLIQYTTTSSGWATHDVSSATTQTGLSTPPSLVTGPNNVLRLYTTAANGDVLEFIPSSRGGWLSTDLTTVYGLRQLSGAPSATVLVNGTSRVVCLFGKTSTGQLMEYSLDGTLAAPWRTHNLSTSNSAGTLLSDPGSYSSGGWVMVSAVRTDGSLVLLVSRGTNFSSAQATATTNFTRMTGTSTESAFTPSLLIVPDGLMIASRGANAHLLVHIANWMSSYTAGTGTDVTTQVGSNTTIESAPGLQLLNGSIHITAGATRGTNGRTDVLGVGQYLTIGQSLTSADHRYRATLQSDGYLRVLTSSNQVLWTSTSTANRITVGGMGNLRFLNTQGASVLLIGSNSGSTTSLVMRTDGVLALMTSDGTIVWSTGATVPNRVVSIALTKIGITETPLGSNCNPFTAFFSRGSTSGCPAGTASEAWCSDFANFVWWWAGADTAGLTGWSYTFVTYGQRHGTF